MSIYLVTLICEIVYLLQINVSVCDSKYMRGEN